MGFKGSFALTVSRWALYATAGLFGAFTAFIIAPSTAGATSDFFNHVVFSALLLLPAVICLTRGFIADGTRKVWLAIGIGILFWWAGDLYSVIVLGDSANPPVPSLADGLYLFFYPAVFVGVFSLLRRLSDVPRTLWLQGVIAALSIAAVDSALVLEWFHPGDTTSVIGMATQLSYPMADLAMLMLVVGARVVAGARLGKAWNWLTGSLVLMVVADTLYLFQTTTGQYTAGGLIDLTWPGAMLVMAVAAMRDDGFVEHIEVNRNWLTLPSVIFASSAVFLITFDHFHPFGIPTLAPAVGALVFVIVELVLSQRENLELLEESRAEAFIDSVTGIANRRALIRDLEYVCRVSTEDSPSSLVLLDLSGFKSYNDKFGHLAGDALLARLGQNLSRVVGGFGAAYRHSGDEFCVISMVPAAQADGVTRVAREALVERGDGFEISGLSGTVLIPQDAVDPLAILKLADQRLYAEKYSHTKVAPEEAAAMINMLQQTSTSTDKRSALIDETLKLAAAVYGMDGEQTQQISRAFQLRDIGNCAIPDAILHKEGKLAEHEWQVIHSHTVVGERILNAIPQLRPVAEIVRYHHERYDGAGYPDGLAGEAIPVGARLVAVAQAFDAMISDRPFRPALTFTEAVGELGREAGHQFDPRALAAFCQALDQTSFAIHESGDTPEPATAIDAVPGAAGAAEGGGGRPALAAATANDVAAPFQPRGVMPPAEPRPQPVTAPMGVIGAYSAPPRVATPAMSAMYN